MSTRTGLPNASAISVNIVTFSPTVTLDLDANDRSWKAVPA